MFYVKEESNFSVDCIFAVEKKVNKNSDKKTLKNNLFSVKRWLRESTNSTDRDQPTQYTPADLNRNHLL